MLSEREVTAAIGSTAYGDGGGKLGIVEHFFVDDRTGEPTWVAVTTGLFGTRHSIAPARGATWADGRLQLPVTADEVKSAPAMAGDHLDPGAEEELRRHYGLGGAAHTPAVTVPPSAAGDVEPAAGFPTTEPTGTDAGAVRTPAVDGTDPAGTVPGGDTVVLPTTPPVPDSPSPRHAAPDDGGAAVADGAMTRSEEQLRVTTERVPDRRVRVVKYVVTEEVQVTVPIRREEIRIEEIPLDTGDGADGSLTSATSSGLPEEIVLHTERPVVSVEVVPVERVRLRTELVQSQETVSGQVRREQVVVDEDTVPGSPTVQDPSSG